MLNNKKATHNVNNGICAGEERINVFDGRVKIVSPGISTGNTLSMGNKTFLSWGLGAQGVDEGMCTAKTTQTFCYASCVRAHGACGQCELIILISRSSKRISYHKVVSHNHLLSMASIILVDDLFK